MTFNKGLKIIKNNKNAFQKTICFLVSFVYPKGWIPRQLPLWGLGPKIDVFSCFFRSSTFVSIFNDFGHHFEHFVYPKWSQNESKIVSRTLSGTAPDSGPPPDSQKAWFCLPGQWIEHVHWSRKPLILAPFLEAKVTKNTSRTPSQKLPVFLSPFSWKLDVWCPVSNLLG